MQNKVLILDFGSQYTQLIARRVRELNIYCEIHPYNKLPKQIDSFDAVILSGSPFSVRSDDAPRPDLSKIKGKIPLLGVCYGAQYLAHFGGGEVAPSDTREYGRANLMMIIDDPLFENISQGSQVWMSHSDTIKSLPDDGLFWQVRMTCILLHIVSKGKQHMGFSFTQKYIIQQMANSCCKTF